MDVTIPGQIREHNASADAHSDIRQKIEDKAADIGQAMENAAVAAAAALSSHNTSEDAHKALIDGVKRSVAQNAESIGSLRTDLDAESSNRAVAIENHNASPSAHADLRQSVRDEAARAQAAESGLAGTISQEASRATAAEAALDSRITQNNDALSQFRTEQSGLHENIEKATNDLRRELAISQRDVENLKAAAQGTIYREVTDDREKHSKVLGDAEICGSDTEVLPNGLLNSVGGRTVVWNQLAFKTDEQAINVGSANRVITFTTKGAISGRKYYASYCVKVPNGVSVKSTIQYESMYDAVDITGSGEYITRTKVFTTRTEGGSLALVLKRIDSDEPALCNVKDIIFIDLTKMFGAGNEPATVEEFEAMVDTSVYHPYDPGTLMSLPVREVIVAYGNDVRYALPFTRLASLPGYGWSAGTARNWVDFEKMEYHQEVEAVDLGKQMYWANAGSRFYVVIYPEKKMKLSNTPSMNGVVKNYVSTRKDWTALLDGEASFQQAIHGGAFGGDACFKNSNYSTLSDFKASLDGVLLYYELAEPIITPLSDLLPDFDLDPTLPGLETGGTVTLIADGTAPDGSVLVPADQLSLPQPNSISYLCKIGG